MYTHHTNYDPPIYYLLQMIVPTNQFPQNIIYNFKMCFYNNSAKLMKKKLMEPIS